MFNYQPLMYLSPSNSPLTLPFLFHHFKHFFKMMEKKNNDKGELINRTAWFTRLYIYIWLALLSFGS